MNRNADSTTDGAANQAWIVANKTLANYPAFDVCENLVRHGHDDWYLPARTELETLYANKSTIGDFSTGRYFSSTEFFTSNAYSPNFSDGSAYFDLKSSSLYVRCVRRN